MCIQVFTNSVSNCYTCCLHAFVYVCMCVDTRLQACSDKNAFIKHIHTYKYMYMHLYGVGQF